MRSLDDRFSNLITSPIMARGIEIHLTPEVGSMLQDDMQIATNGADEGMARNANHRSQDKKNHSAKSTHIFCWPPQEF